MLGAIGFTLLGLVVSESASQSSIQDTDTAVFKKQFGWLGIVRSRWNRSFFSVATVFVLSL